MKYVPSSLSTLSQRISKSLVEGSFARRSAISRFISSSPYKLRQITAKTVTNREKVLNILKKQCKHIFRSIMYLFMYHDSNVQFDMKPYQINYSNNFGGFPPLGRSQWHF